MIQMLRLLLLLSGILMLSANPVSAQFEGDIRFEISNPLSSGNEVRNMSIAFSDAGIFINSDLSMNLMAGLRAQGVLVRHDLNDFIILTDDNEGLKVEKDELDSMIMLVNRMQGKNPNARPEPFPWEEKVRESGRTRTIQGYEAVEFILDGDEEKNEKVSVWLTDQIRVRWGVLQDAWHTAGASQFENEVPIEMVMNNSSFPLLIEVIRDENVIYRAEAVHVESPLRNRKITELPPHIKVIGFTDLMMNIFRQQ